MPENFPAFNTDYTDPFGLWEVYTEGDEEGKSPPVHLGTFIGYFDKIAIALSGKAMHALTFRKTNPEIPAHISCPADKKVRVRLNNYSNNTTSSLLERMLQGRQVTFHRSSTHYSYPYLEISDKQFDEIKRQVALAKLTKEEQKLLGLTE